MNTYQLQNGLNMVVEKIPTFRSVSFGIWVKSGSRYENQWNNGISHFIEHMLFKGTDRYTAQEIAEIFDGIGGNMNAFTAKEYTCYYFKILDEHFPIAVDVLSSMFFDSTFELEEFKKERKVILEEIAMYDDTPDDLVHDLSFKASFGSESLGQTIVGTDKSLDNLTPDHLREHMNNFYTMDNTVISMVGNINDDMIQLVEKLFSRRTATTIALHNDPIPFLGERIYHNKNTEQNHICLTLPGRALDDEYLYAMILLNNVVGGGMSSRLFQEIRENRGLAYSVYSYHSAYINNGLFTIYAGTAPQYSQEVLDITKQIMQDVAQNGINEAELKKGKEQLKGNLILSLESSSSRMNRIGKNELMLGKHYSLDELIHNISNVSLQDIKTVAEEMHSHPFALAVVGKNLDTLHFE